MTTQPDPDDTKTRSLEPAAPESATVAMEAGAAPSDAVDETDSVAIRRRISERVNERLFGSKPAATRIGRFLVLEELGRGGMGVVYSAYDEQLDRKVAIKLLLDERYDDEARRRFQREGQAMARVSHPNVVTVHEVGEADGDVFLAMEFIRGQSLSQWLRTEPAWAEVVEAFVCAGEGLIAAHAAGLVHRDLKPHNMMRSDDGVVKVLDFGLARALLETETNQEHGPPRSLDATEESALSPFTSTGTVLGTPAYMSPEQLQGLAVDERSDQFSFCVAFYEGLHGERPFAGKTLQTLMASMLAAEVRPAPKGRKVPAAVRKVLLRGLARDPADRWPSMDALLTPLRAQITPRRRGWIAPAVVVGVLGAGVGIGVDRYAEASKRCTGAASHLEGTWDEGTRQTVRDAILGTDVTYAPDTWNRVEQRLDDYASRWARAHTEACEATAVRREQSEHHLGLRMGCLEKRRQHLQATVGELARASTTTVRHAIDAIERMPALSRCADVDALAAAVPPPEDPAVAERVEALEQTLVEIEAKQRAGQYDEGLEMIEAVLAEASPLEYEPLMARVWLRAGLLRAETGDYEPAEALLGQAYDAAMARGMTAEAAEASAMLTRLLGSKLARHEHAHRWAKNADPLSRAVQQDEARAFYLQSLGYVVEDEGEHERAGVLFDEARGLLERALGPDHLLVAELIANQGGVAYLRGEYDAASESYGHAQRIFEAAMGSEHPQVGSLLQNLGNVAFRQGEYDRARDRFARARAIFEAALGPEHPETARAINALGSAAEMLGEIDDARSYYQKALAIWEQTYGPEHPEVAGALMNLGVLLVTQREYERARQPLERALAILEKVRGPEHPQIAAVLSNLGNAASGQGRLEDARNAYERALKIQRKLLGEDHLHVAFNLFNLADVVGQEGRHDDARDLLLRVLEVEKKVMGPEAPQVGATLNNLGLQTLALREYDAAREFFERALVIKEKTLGPDNMSTALTVGNLGIVAVEQGEYGRAREYLERALAMKEKSVEPENQSISNTLLALGRMYVGQGDPAKAIGIMERALGDRIATGAEPATLAMFRFTLARALWDAPATAGRDRSRARSLAEQALEGLAEQEAEDWLDRAEIEAWLRQHRGP